MGDEQITIKGLAEGLALVIEAVKEINESNRRQLLIKDSQIRALNEVMDRLDALEARFEEVLHDYKAHCRICARLNILCSPAGTKQGTTNDSDEKDINKKLTDWH